MILAELPGRITQGLQQIRDRWVFLLQSERRARKTDFGHSSPQSRLTGNERRATGCATLLAVVVGEHHPFGREAVYVGRLITHHTTRVGADVGLPDIVAPNNYYVRAPSGVGRRTLLLSLGKAN